MWSKMKSNHLYDYHPFAFGGSGGCDHMILIGKQSHHSSAWQYEAGIYMMEDNEIMISK